MSVLCTYEPHFSHISAKCAYRIFFPHKLAFLTAILIFYMSLLPISSRFRYLDHLVANRMAPSMCPDPCGTRRRSRFQAILYHISANFWRSAYFLPHKTDKPIQQVVVVTTERTVAVASVRHRGHGERQPCCRRREPSTCALQTCHHHTITRGQSNLARGRTAACDVAQW